VKTIHELMLLKDRVAVVTGGAGYVGSIVCEALAEAGASVVVLDIAQKQCDRIAASIATRFGIEAIPLHVDLSVESEVRSIPERVLAHFGKLNILVNCAALVGTSDLDGWTVAFEKQCAKIWRKALEVNLTSVFILVQACADALRSAGKTSIVNVSSIYGIVGPDMRLYEGTHMGNPAAYAASKGGLVQLTRWLATVLAPEIRVNALSMGGIYRNQDDVFVKKYTERTPLSRMGTEEDVKGAIVYLASDMSAYVTGQNLLVDGGWTVW